MNPTIRHIYSTNHHTYPLPENLRLELAHGDNLDYHERIKKAKDRGKVLFNELFKNEEKIQLIFIINEEGKKSHFKKYLYHNNFVIRDSFSTTELFLEWGEYEKRDTILVIETPMANIKINQLIDSLSYQDFFEYGKMKINHSFAFFNEKENIIFTLYDDRGCDIWSDDFNRMQEIYKKYNDWLLDYDLDKMKAFYD